MQRTRYLLIGGGLASQRAAAGIRKHDKESGIIIVGSEPHPPYHRPPLSKDFMQQKASRDAIFAKPEQWYEENNITLITGVPVEKLDAEGKIAQLADGRQIDFDKALLATGGRPIRLDLPGIEQQGVSLFRTVDDAQAVSDLADKDGGVAIIGGGFIGVELAASLTQRGVKATVIDLAPHIWPRFANAELAEYIQDHCRQRGVDFVFQDKPVELLGQEGRVSGVKLESGREIPCEFACVAVGIVPNVELAQQANLELDNGVATDDRLRTSNPDIYAAGDVATFPDPFFGVRRRVEHWGNADYSGRLAGENMAGADKPYDLLTYVFSDVFDLHIEFAGWEHDADETRIRGKMAEDSFSVLYFKNNRLGAYFAVNVESGEFAAFGELIEEKVDLFGKFDALSDPSVPVKSLKVRTQ